ncbi:transposase [Streptomyces mauvecolor]|uniref:Transposase n=1 Tax=Streptomyces mauvecolor TaxID=58345 RepID=A0ABV9UT73_9ACTN
MSRPGRQDGGRGVPPVAEVAREIQVNEGTLGTWVSRYRQERAGDEPHLKISERARLRELERENREFPMKTEVLGKAAAFFAQEYRWRRSTSSSTAKPTTFRCGGCAPGRESPHSALPLEIEAALGHLLVRKRLSSAGSGRSPQTPN